MSELSELIKINRNIERQNEEIIRLLKKIASEKEETEIPAPPMMPDYIKETVREVPSVDITPERDESEMLLNGPHEVGEVCFIENRSLFRLVRKNNKTTVNNMNSMAYPIDFKLQEIVAVESVKRNRSLDDATVILNSSQSMALPETLKICFDEGAKNVYIPISSMTQLIGAPESLMSIMKIDFYKSDEHLIEKLFGDD